MSQSTHHRTGRARLAALAGAALLAASVPVLALQSEERASLAERVESTLRAEGRSLDDVTAEVTNGIVELRGYVDSLAARDVAEEVVAFTPEIRGVVNRIEVRNDRPASEIAEEYRELLREEPGTESFQIDALVRDGALILGGTVDSAAEKNLAGMAARRVEGVREVTNNLEVRPSGTARSDAEIDQEIRSLLQWDARVDESLVAVAVQDGAVSLAGVARTPMEKTQAILLAHVDGVKSVEASELLVELEDDPARARKVPAAAGSDAEIARAVEKAIAVDSRLPEETLEVRVDDGVVSLSGEVGRLATRHVAEETVENVVGVARVINTLTVVPTERLSADQVRENVRSALGHDPLVELEDIEIEVSDGVVTLTGAVPSERVHDRAVEAASRALGVLEVESELQVGSQS